jgi:hypothetical protein
MQTLESVGQTRTVIARSLLYFAFGRRLLRRYIKLSLKHHSLRRQLRSFEGQKAVQLNALRTSKDREIFRLNELVQAYQTKLEITQRESFDRILETFKTIGISHTTREADEKIQTLRYQPYEEARKQNQSPYEQLTPEIKAVYDEMYENHRQMGVNSGFSESEIDRIWKENEENILADIERNAN